MLPFFQEASVKEVWKKATNQKKEKINGQVFLEFVIAREGFCLDLTNLRTGQR